MEPLFWGLGKYRKLPHKHPPKTDEKIYGQSKNANAQICLNNQIKTPNTNLRERKMRLKERNWDLDVGVAMKCSATKRGGRAWGRTGAARARPTFLPRSRSSWDPLLRKWKREKNERWKKIQAVEKENLGLLSFKSRINLFFYFFVTLFLYRMWFLISLEEEFDKKRNKREIRDTRNQRKKVLWWKFKMNLRVFMSLTMVETFWLFRCQKAINTPKK